MENRIRLIACEPCRERKVRCTGNAPCDQCQRQMLHCSFKLDRRRRGPRPKGRPQNAAVPAKSTAGMTSSTLWSLNLSLWTEWKIALATLMGSEAYQLCSGYRISVDVTLHLLVTFFNTVNRQQLSILRPDSFFRRLMRRQCSRGLCHALCAVACQYTKHKIVQEIGLENLQNHLTHDSRSSLAAQSHEVGILGQTQARCALAMQEQRKGNGFQALHDLTAALDLMSNINANEAPDEETTEEIAVLDLYLCMAEFLAKKKLLRPSKGMLTSISLRITEVCDDRDDVISTCASLIHLASRVGEFSKKNFAHMFPAPWAPNSEYQSIRNESILLRIRLARGLSFDEALMGTQLSQGLSVETYVTPLLLWHYSNLILHRIFLPVPITADQGPGSSGNDNIALKKHIDFPFAPDEFLKERFYSSLASASSICAICRSVVNVDVVLISPFMGYCLFQAGLVLLTYLYVGDDAVSRLEVLEDLKDVFTLLGNLTGQFAPARLWLDTLFSAHRTARLPQAVGHAPMSLFSQYFDRFPGLTEPPFCPLDSSTLRLYSSTSSTAYHTNSSTPDSRSDTVAPGDFGTQSSSQSWIMNYQTQLESHINQLHQEITASPGSPEVLERRFRLDSISESVEDESTTTYLSGLDRVSN